MLYLIPSVSVFFTMALFFAAYATQGKRKNRLFRILTAIMAGITLVLFVVWGISRNF